MWWRPPGYGKTTLLAQWAQHKGDRVGWVTIDPQDNDPAVLLTYLAVALDRVAPIDPDTFQILASPWRPIEAMTLRAVLGVGVDEGVRRRGRRPVRRHAAEGRLILCAPSGVLERPATHQTSIRTVAHAD